jgi:hypothetical protein
MADDKLLGADLRLTMRPTSFEDVIGLDETISIIKTKLDKGEVPRAILLRGGYGCGKTSLAHVIAKYIQGPFFEGNPEVHEVNAANYRKIDAMRELVKGCGSYPFVGTYSVIILDECHKLTGDSQDVLLKELEVPKSPTVWILCTTDPDKLNSGVRDRCFALDVKGMDAAQRHALIARAVSKSKYSGDTAPFEAIITKHRIVSPRKILGAFEQLISGATAEHAVGNQVISAAPEYHDIAFAVCFGKWDVETSMWDGKVTVKPISLLLRELEDTLKKKPSPDANTEEMEGSIDDDDVSDSKPEAARALRAVVAAFLKNKLLPKIQKGGKMKYPSVQDCERAMNAMQSLANMIPGDAFELQWSGLIPTLFRVHQRLQGK